MSVCVTSLGFYQHTSLNFFSFQNTLGQRVSTTFSERLDIKYISYPYVLYQQDRERPDKIHQ